MYAFLFFSFGLHLPCCFVLSVLVSCCVLCLAVSVACHATFCKCLAVLHVWLCFVSVLLSCAHVRLAVFCVGFGALVYFRERLVLKIKPQVDRCRAWATQLRYRLLATDSFWPLLLATGWPLAD